MNETTRKQQSYYFSRKKCELAYDAIKLFLVILYNKVLWSLSFQLNF